MGFLYIFKFPSRKSYIGMSTKTKAQRMAKHRYASKKQDTPLYRAWRCHGPPQMQILSWVEDDDLPGLEQRAIVAFGTRAPHGYNATDGGDVSPSTDPIVAEKIRQSKIGKPRPPEVRKIMLENAIRNGKDPTVLAKMRVKAKARWENPEYRETILQAMSKRGPLSDAHRDKISSGNARAWRSGKRSLMSEATKEKIKHTLTGRKLSSEHRANISAGGKRAWSKGGVRHK